MVLDCVVMEMLGNKPWFWVLQHMLHNIPKNQLLPGTNIPFTHAWFSHNPKEVNIHHDWNAIGCGVVFTPKTVEGGDLLVLNKYTGLICCATFSNGTVAAGTWPTHPHCNSKVTKGLHHHK